MQHPTSTPTTKSPLPLPPAAIMVERSMTLSVPENA